MLNMKSKRCFYTWDPDHNPNDIIQRTDRDGNLIIRLLQTRFHLRSFSTFKEGIAYMREKINVILKALGYSAVCGLCGIIWDVKGHLITNKKNV